MLFCLVCGCGLGYRRLHTVVLAVLLYTVTTNCCEMLKLYVVATLMWQT